MFKNVTGLLIALALISAAHADSVVVVGGQDDSKNFPTLTSLCQAQSRSGGNTISLGTAVLAATEIDQLNLRCSFGHTFGRNSVPTLTFELAPTRTIISGTQVFSSVETVRDVSLTTSQVKGHTEVVLVVNGLSSVIVYRYILNLNANGQPLNTLNHFDGTVDPKTLVSGNEEAKDYVSGYYGRQTPADTFKTCVLQADEQSDFDQCAALAKDPANASRKVAIPVGAQLNDTIAVHFGWKADQMPTNTDLDKAAGRVDFNKAVSELQALIQRDYAHADPAVTTSLVREAKDALGNAFNN